MLYIRGELGGISIWQNEIKTDQDIYLDGKKVNARLFQGKIVKKALEKLVGGEIETTKTVLIIGEKVIPVRSDNNRPDNYITIDYGIRDMPLLEIPAASFCKDSFQNYSDENGLESGQPLEYSLRHISFVVNELKKGLKFEIKIINDIDTHWHGFDMAVVDDILDRIPDDLMNEPYNNEVITEFERFFGVRFCRRCNWVWIPRVKDPVTCPNCGSTRWSVNRTGNEPGPKPKK